MDRANLEIGVYQASNVVESALRRCKSLLEEQASFFSGKFEVPDIKVIEGHHQITQYGSHFRFELSPFNFYSHRFKVVADFILGNQTRLSLCLAKPFVSWQIIYGGASLQRMDPYAYSELPISDRNDHEPENWWTKEYEGKYYFFENEWYNTRYFNFYTTLIPLLAEVGEFEDHHCNKVLAKILKRKTNERFHFPVSECNSFFITFERDDEKSIYYASADQ